MTIGIGMADAQPWERTWITVSVLQKDNPVLS